MYICTFTGLHTHWDSHTPIPRLHTPCQELLHTQPLCSRLTHRDDFRAECTFPHVRSRIGTLASLTARFLAHSHPSPCTLLPSRAHASICTAPCIIAHSGIRMHADVYLAHLSCTLTHMPLQTSLCTLTYILAQHSCTLHMQAHLCFHTHFQISPYTPPSLAQPMHTLTYLHTCPCGAPLLIPGTAPHPCTLTLAHLPGTLTSLSAHLCARSHATPRPRLECPRVPRSSGAPQALGLPR